MRSRPYRILQTSENGIETEFMHKKWEKEFDSLEEDLDRFRDYYNGIKKCKCHIDECKHYEVAVNKVFRKKIDELWNLKLQVGFRTFNSIYKPE